MKCSSSSALAISSWALPNADKNLNSFPFANTFVNNGSANSNSRNFSKSSKNHTPINIL